MFDIIGTVILVVIVAAMVAVAINGVVAKFVLEHACSRGRMTQHDCDHLNDEVKLCLLFGAVLGFAAFLTVLYGGGPAKVVAVVLLAVFGAIVVLLSLNWWVRFSAWRAQPSRRADQSRVNSFN
ncbi:MAG TPA: hypothetical protein VN081_00575 [Dongiaceae bacterium]|nr:hypothetical protein [Dongiaceae bacterium]